MRNEAFFITGILFHLVVVRKVLTECNPQLNMLMDKYDGLTQAFIIWNGSVPSKIGCIKKCYNVIRCVTFQHSPVGECRIYATTITVLKLWNTGTEQGTITYQLPSRDAYGQECMLDGDCRIPNSQCRLSICGCIIGYTFNPMENACTNGCTVYGNSYEIFPTYLFYASGISNTYAPTIKECMDLCSSNINCKAIDYLPKTRDCYLKNSTSLDDPDQLKSGQNHGTHAVRNCN